MKPFIPHTISSKLRDTNETPKERKERLQTVAQWQADDKAQVNKDFAAKLDSSKGIISAIAKYATPPKPKKEFKVPKVKAAEIERVPDVRYPSHKQVDKETGEIKLVGQPQICKDCQNTLSNHKNTRHKEFVDDRENTPIGQKVSLFVPKDKATYSEPKLLHPANGLGQHIQSHSDKFTQPTKNGPKKPKKSSTNFGVVSLGQTKNMTGRGMDPNKKPTDESTTYRCHKHLMEAIQKWVSTGKLGDKGAPGVNNFIGKKIILPKTLDGTQPYKVNVPRKIDPRMPEPTTTPKKSGREAFNALFKENNMNEQDLDEIVNTLIGEAMGNYDAGQFNTTAGSGTGSGDNMGRAKQMLSGEFVGSAATPFQQSINQELEGSVALQQDQANGKLGEAVNEVIAGLLEDSPSIYTDSDSVGYLINSLSECGYESYAGTLTEICNEIDENSVAKINHMIYELSKAEGNEFFVEQLTVFAMQLIEMEEV